MYTFVPMLFTAVVNARSTTGKNTNHLKMLRGEIKLLRS